MKVGVTLFSNVGYVILEQNSSIVNCTLLGLMQGGIQMHYHLKKRQSGCRSQKRKIKKRGMVKMSHFTAHTCVHTYTCTLSLSLSHTQTHTHTHIHTHSLSPSHTHTLTHANIIARMQNHTCTLDMSQTYLACIF